MVSTLSKESRAALSCTRVLKPQVSSALLRDSILQLERTLMIFLSGILLHQQTEARDDLPEAKSELMAELGLQPQAPTNTTCF